jgi:3-oxoacyl-[acyl-carrier-protein] synthase-1
MRRVVVTGIGIVSSLGSSVDTVCDALRSKHSGLTECRAMAELGFRSHVYAPVRGFDAAARLPKPQLRASLTAQYALGASMEAVRDAGLDEEALTSDRTAVIIGSAFGDLTEAARAEQVLDTRKSPSRLGGVGAIRMMNSTASGHVATHFHTGGRAYSISSSFATGVDSIGHAYELIRYGVQDIAICGGAEEAVWRSAGVSFETTGSMAHSFNNCPQRACRPYDIEREGIVLSEGAGILILESLDDARRRDARIRAEIVGYGSANDGADMFRPTGEGLRLTLRMAVAAAAEHGVHRLDYANAHGTGTRVGDPIEAAVLGDVLGNETWVSSTKGLSGHALGAAGAQEAVYTLLMMGNGFIAPTANLEHVDPDCLGPRHAQCLQQAKLRSALSVSTGFGGANACIVFKSPAEIRV